MILDIFWGAKAQAEMEEHPKITLKKKTKIENKELGVDSHRGSPTTKRPGKGIRIPYRP